MVENGGVYVIINNIPKTYHSADLRNFFSQFLESSGFSCFHFRHRPEVQKASNELDSIAKDSMESETKILSRCVSTCCVVKVYEKRVNELIEMYHRKHWVDRKGHTLLTRCFIKKIRVCSDINETDLGNEIYKTKPESLLTPADREVFTQADLATMLEMRPPILMPNGNVGTPTKFFLEQINACRLPSSIITKLNLEFPRSRSKRLYGCVDFNYGGRRRKNFNKNQWKPIVTTSRGHIISDMYDDNQILKAEDNSEDNSEIVEEVESDEDDGEEWDRHESLHNDVTQQDRTKERLFEDKIELKWEKGGSGLVFYTDAQFWDAKEGDFDAKTADDWDIDMSAYYEPGAGDKDARDFLRMRLEERLRQGTTSEKVDSNDFAGFEKHSRGFGRRVLEAQGWKQGQGVGKSTTGITEPLMEIGQHPRDKKGFGYRGEKLTREIMTKSKRRRRSSGYEEDRIYISTIYDNPLESDPPEPLLRSDFLTRLKYKKEFLKGTPSHES